MSAAFGAEASVEIPILSLSKDGDFGPDVQVRLILSSN
jgi:hypothetical protein